MRDTVIRTIAEYMEATHEDVAHWDRPLIHYFIRHPMHFEEFVHGDFCTRYLAWMQALRHVASIS